MADSDLTPKFAPFLGMAGIAFAMIFGCTSPLPHHLQRTHAERGLDSQA